MKVGRGERAGEAAEAGGRKWMCVQRRSRVREYSVRCLGRGWPGARCTKRSWWTAAEGGASLGYNRARVAEMQLVSDVVLVYECTVFDVWAEIGPGHRSSNNQDAQQRQEEQAWGITARV